MEGRRRITPPVNANRDMFQIFKPLHNGKRYFSELEYTGYIFSTYEKVSPRRLDRLRLKLHNFSNVSFDR